MKLTHASLLELDWGYYWFFYVSCVLANIMPESSCWFQKWDRDSGCRFCITVCPKTWVDHYILIYTNHGRLMKSLGSHGSSSLLFVMKVMVWHHVSNSHKVMTALIFMFPSNCCCGDFSVISWICNRSSFGDLGLYHGRNLPVVVQYWVQVLVSASLGMLCDTYMHNVSRLGTVKQDVSTVNYLLVALENFMWDSGLWQACELLLSKTSPYFQASDALDTALP